MITKCIQATLQNMRKQRTAEMEGYIYQLLLSEYITHFLLSTLFITELQ
jgi:hypothetical protein